MNMPYQQPTMNYTPNVDEKYYINNEKADKLIKQLIDNGTLPQHNLDRQTDRQTGRQADRQADLC